LCRVAGAATRLTGTACVTTGAPARLPVGGHVGRRRRPGLLNSPMLLPGCDEPSGERTPAGQGRLRTAHAVQQGRIRHDPLRATAGDDGQEAGGRRLRSRTWSCAPGAGREAVGASRSRPWSDTEPCPSARAATKPHGPISCSSWCTEPGRASRPGLPRPPAVTLVRGGRPGTSGRQRNLAERWRDRGDAPASGPRRKPSSGESSEHAGNRRLSGIVWVERTHPLPGGAGCSAGGMFTRAAQAGRSEHVRPPRGPLVGTCFAARHGREAAQAAREGHPECFPEPRSRLRT